MGHAGRWVVLSKAVQAPEAVLPLRNSSAALHSSGVREGVGLENRGSWCWAAETVRTSSG
jgi:hypothetical protein